MAEATAIHSTPAAASPLPVPLAVEAPGGARGASSSGGASAGGALAGGALTGGALAGGAPVETLPAAALGEAASGTWFEAVRDRILNLSTTDSDLLKLFSSELRDASPAQQVVLQQLADLRSRAIATLSQLIRIFSETARQIIGNIR